MLTIHFGREDVDKEAFMFSEIHKRLKALEEAPEKGGRVLLVVPDQFTLQAERNAFFYLRKEGFIDLEIISLSKLRHKVIEKTGMDTRIPVGEDGRQMLLTLILRRQSGNLQAFSTNRDLGEMVTLINNFISEMKYHNVTTDDIRRVIEAETQPILARKLSDLLRIYIDYEATIAGKYLDNEDHSALVAVRIPESKWISGSVIWLYGFDYLSTRDLDVVQALFCRARDFNVLLTADRLGFWGPGGGSAGGSAGGSGDSVVGSGDGAGAGSVGGGSAGSSAGGSGDSAVGNGDGAGAGSVGGGIGAGSSNAGDSEGGSCVVGNGVSSADGSVGAVGSSDGGLFRLTRQMIADICGRADSAGVTYKTVNLNKQCQAQKGRPKPIQHIERELFSYPYNVYRGKAPEIVLLSAANYYAEADSAASEIYRLIREHGYRYRDILVICNDMDVRAAVIKRVFSQYNLPLFVDRKKSLHHNPILEYISILVDIATGNWRTDEIIRLIKTGFSPLNPMESEILDECAAEFKLKWKRDWLNPPWLRLKSDKSFDSGIGIAEQARLKITDHIRSFTKIYNESKNAAKRTEAFYLFLRDEARLPEKLSLYIKELRDNQKHMYAAELSQLWDQLMGVFDQITAIAGESDISGPDYKTLLVSGLEHIEIGLIPTTLDQILLGTMQRTRPGRIKALFVLGANDGVLPADSGDEGLFTENERSMIFEKHHFGKADGLKAEEEQLAIYRNLARPLERLWLSYSTSNPEGNELRPSLIFEKVRKIFQGVNLEKDIGSRNDPLALIGTKNSTLNHLAAAIRSFTDDEGAAGVWNPVYAWYRENALESIRFIEKGLLFTNRRETVRKDYIRQLYGSGKSAVGYSDGIIGHSVDVGKTEKAPESASTHSPAIRLSPSSIERYARCPFSHFIGYGLRPKEKRIFQIGPRERGDLLHQIIMEYSKELTEGGIRISDSSSRWVRMTRSESDALVDRLFDVITNTIVVNRERTAMIINNGNVENYRVHRIKDAVKVSAWTLAEHVKAGGIDSMLYEERFGFGRRFPAIVKGVDGLDITIEGQIDRVDIMGGRAKIIDYKSGSEWFDIEEARSGWKLQLMLYLQAVTEFSAADAGVSTDACVGKILDADTGMASDACADKTLGTIADIALSVVTGANEASGTYVSASSSVGGYEIPHTEVSELTRIRSESGETAKLEPAGVFYFRIKEPRLDCEPWSGLSAESNSEKLESEIRKSFRMDGVMLDDQEVLRSIAGTDWRGKHYNKQGFSDIIPVKMKTDEFESVKLVRNHPGSMKLLDKDGLAALQRDVEDRVDELCIAMANGEIAVSPGRSKSATACDYCNFKGICCYDPAFL